MKSIIMPGHEQLDKKAKGGVFIISVDPFSIAASAQNPNDMTMFVENKDMLAKTKLIDLKPNFFYLINTFAIFFIGEVI